MQPTFSTQSIRKLIASGLGVLATFGVFFSAGFGSVFAATSAVAPRSADAPAGRVLQAATSTCKLLDRKSGGYGTGTPYEDVSYEGLDISVSPTTVKVGQQMTFTFSVKPECRDKLSGAGNFDIGLYQPSFTLGQNGFTRLQSQPSSGTFQLLASTNNFSVGGHRVVAALVSNMPKDVIATTNWLTGGVDFTVEAAAQTGNASLNNQFVASGLDPNGIFYEYSFSYQPGGTGINPGFISVDCGGGTLSLPNPIPYGSGGNAKCIFPKPPAGQPKDYTISFQALDNSKPPVPIPGATSTAKVTVTGNESNSNYTTPQDPSCFGISNALICGLNSIVGGLVSIFTSILKYAVVDIIGPLIEAVLSIRTYSDDFAQVIYAAWEVLRNIGNIFFILAIVAIGIATVFRISGWAVKDLLVKLIIGALLINFSLTICQAVLGVADTVQAQFLSSNTGAIKAIANPLFTADPFRDAPGANLGEFSNTVRIVINFCIVFGAFIAFVGVLFLLLVRLVMLWILLLLSPLPYMAMVLPATKSMSSKWWSQFFKWAFITPVVAFMLNLTALITEQNKDAIQKLTTLSPNFTSSDVRVIAFSTASNLIPLAFLFMTLKAGSTFGKGAAGFVDKAIDKGLGAAFLPAAAIGGLAGGAATKLASGVGAVAKAPITLAGKSIGRQKDNLKLWGMGQVGQRLKPSAKDTGVKGFVKRHTFNALSGGAYSQAKEAELKEKISDKQSEFASYGKDFRNAVTGKKLVAAEREENKVRNKAVKEVGDSIDNEDPSKNANALKDTLDAGGTIFSKEVEAEARIKKALEERTLPKLMEAVAGTGATIEDFYAELLKKGFSVNSLERYRKQINANQLDKGAVHNAVDTGFDMSKLTSPAQLAAFKTSNVAFRDSRWVGKTVEELAAIKKDMYSEQDPTSGARIPSALLATLVSEFRSPEAARNINLKLTTEQKKEIKNIVTTQRADLISAMTTSTRGPQMTSADATNALRELSKVI